jgi:hypothetical protein
VIFRVGPEPPDRGGRATVSQDCSRRLQAKNQRLPESTRLGKSLLYIHFNIHFLQHRRRVLSESVAAPPQPRSQTVRCHPRAYRACAVAPYFQSLDRICPTVRKRVADSSPSQGL